MEGDSGVLLYFFLLVYPPRHAGVMTMVKKSMHDKIVKDRQARQKRSIHVEDYVHLYYQSLSLKEPM